MSTLTIHNSLSEYQSDSKLQQLIETVSLPELNSTKNVFHDLISCVVEQQIHYRSSKKTFEKLLSFTSIEELTPHNFHEFEKLALPRTKLSERKYETIMNVLEFWGKNQFEWNQLSDDEVRSNLSSIKGIGNWTIDMILLYTLQRPDIFPADDYHLKLIMAKVYNLESSSGLKARMKEISNEWKPNRSIVVRYLLEAKKQGVL